MRRRRRMTVRAEARSRDAAALLHLCLPDDGMMPTEPILTTRWVERVRKCDRE